MCGVDGLFMVISPVHPFFINKSKKMEDEKLPLDESSMLKLLSDAELARKKNFISVTIDGKRWKVRTTSQSQNEKMTSLDYDILFWQKSIKEAKTSKEAKRLNKKIREAYAKKAAHKVLGMVLIWVPFLYSIMWRIIYHSSEKVSATINSTEVIGENKVFFLANLGTSKQALALSMSQVGEAIEQRKKRGESAENMVRKDGSEKRADNKS